MRRLSVGALPDAERFEHGLDALRAAPSQSRWPSAPGLTAGAVVELRFEWRQLDWADVFCARGRVRRGKVRLQELLLLVLFAVVVWLLAESVLAVGCAFLGSLSGFIVRRGVLTARMPRWLPCLGLGP